MSIQDRHYLELQFQCKIYRSYGLGFQHFFEKVMNKLNPKFIPINSSGGDDGNDGYFRDEGKYYQIYSPKSNMKNEDAAKKLYDDFYKLYDKWNHTNPIKEYHFVFNDKYYGSKKEIEPIITKLKSEKLGINFELILMNDFERLFFKLSKEAIYSLGFHISSTTAISYINEQFKLLEIELDRENITFLEKSIPLIGSSIEKLNEESLLLNYDYLKARFLQKNEQIISAKNELESMMLRYPNDPKAYLLLTSVHLNDKEFSQADELLQKIAINHSNDDLYKLRVIQQKLIMKEMLDDGSEPEFSNIKIRASYYNLSAVYHMSKCEHREAQQYIERALRINPDSANLYITKVMILWGIIYKNQESNPETNLTTNIEDFNREIEKVECKFNEFMTSSPRLLLQLEFYKLVANLAINNIPKINENTNNALINLQKCNFDQLIDSIITELLRILNLNKELLDSICNYVMHSNGTISDTLAKTLFLSFAFRNEALISVEEFFNIKQNKLINNLINHIKSQDYQLILDDIRNDPDLAYFMAIADGMVPELKLKIINAGIVSEDQRQWLLFKYHSLLENKHMAFEVIKDIDVDILNYWQCYEILPIFENQNCWEKTIPIINKLLKLESNNLAIIDLKLKLHYSYFMLKDNVHSTQTGVEILEEHHKELDKNLEPLLNYTITSYMNRNLFKEALEIFEQYHTDTACSQKFKTFMIEVCIKNNLPEKALQFMLDSIIMLGTPLPEEYAEFGLTAINILNGLANPPFSSLPEVISNCFVQLDDNPKWFYIGDQICLDATPVKQNDALKRYDEFINKKIGNTVIINKFIKNSDKKNNITKIYDLKNYVLWQIHHYANSLASEGRLDNIIPFDLLLNEDGTPDLSNLIKFMGNSFPENDEILNLYKHAEVPLAFLAASMQGLLYAITKINQENAGFIRCCPLFTGNYNQIDVAKNIFENKIECYLDVTSALFLSITGILEKVTPFILKLKVPSSVLNYLHQLVAKSINYPGHAGSLSYNKGQLIFFKKDDDSQQNYIQLLNKAIGWLEQNCEIINISESSKNDDVLESRFPSELVDACILAQRDRKIVLTEDPLYLHANNLITKKTLPDYCSSIVLVKLLADKRKITFNEYLEYLSSPN